MTFQLIQQYIFQTIRVAKLLRIKSTNPNLICSSAYFQRLLYVLIIHCNRENRENMPKIIVYRTTFSHYSAHANTSVFCRKFAKLKIIFYKRVWGGGVYVLSVCAAHTRFTLASSRTERNTENRFELTTQQRARALKRCVGVCLCVCGVCVCMIWCIQSCAKNAPSINISKAHSVPAADDVKRREDVCVLYTHTRICLCAII